MDSSQVYLNRPWMNHSTNAFSGWTITVTAATGAIIVSALAILVTIAGESMWSIVAFSLHQHRATKATQTGLFRQIQVILRNSSTSLSDAYEIVKTGRAWHKQRTIDKALLKACAIALWPAVLFISFTAAGIFVAKVTTPAYEVSQILLRPTKCGFPLWNNNDVDTTFQLQAKWANDARQSRAYAIECYNTTTLSPGCTNLPVQTLPYKTNHDCPLNSSCNPFVEFDTDLLDSHKHLGINAKHSDRVKFQLHTLCAVMPVEDYVQHVLDPNSNGESYYLRVFLGPGVLNNFHTNYTWQYATIQTLLSMPYSVE